MRPLAHPRLSAAVAAVAAVACAVPAAAAKGGGHGSGSGDGAGTNPVLALARDSAPVVLTGAQVPAWAAPAAEGIGKPYPSGSGQPSPVGSGVRSAHNGKLYVPPTPPGQTRVDPATIAAYAWVNGKWKQVPVQVDQRFPYFLANGHSSFGIYSGTDEELTYAWGSDRHAVGEEAWKKLFGQCSARYAASQAEVDAAFSDGVASPEPGHSLDHAAFGGYGGAMADPQPLFDTDDEIAFMARDAGPQAPAGVAPPKHAADGQAVTIADPLDPTNVRYVYLFTQPGGSSYNATNGYVHLTRDGNADQWVDQYSFNDGDPMKIGTSNTGYGPNLSGTTCVTSSENLQRFSITDPTTPRHSTDHNPRDGMTVTTPTYRVHATGRWLVQQLNVADPATRTYGPNVIARWKGRAFQQSPNSSVSVVGFEDEQVNWEMNSALLGWRQGPVRAIREIWGADSGTNVTKTEFYYRDADVYGYHVRVHPIPADGLYTDWDYRPGVATTYYNLKQTGGVAIDGIPDNVGEVDQVPVTGQDAEVNSCDPTFDVCSALDRPEEIAGPGFGLVYEFELTGPTAAAGNVAAVPYYRDDACFDDGTGDAPVQRPFPGDAFTDNGSRVEKAYLATAVADGAPAGLTWPQLMDECHKYAAAQPWGRMPFQAAIGEHGIHFFVTQDSDNAWSPKNTDELDGQQWRFEVPMAQPTNVLVPYGANVSAKLVPVVTPYE